MIASLLGAGIAALATPVPHPAPPPSSPWPRAVRITQLTVRTRVVVRVERAPPPPVTLVERRAPRCLALATVAGAAVTSPSGVDFILRGGQRVRARFSSGCPALDYYSGFYIVPNGDGMVCADRDVIRSRAGGECAIDRMRLLVAKPVR